MHRNEIANLIPHGAAMCLLDTVENWDQQKIHCTTASHLRADNPLLTEGCLHATALIEYGAQAAAVHGGLIHSHLGNAARPAYVGAVKGVQMSSAWLESSVKVLQVDAEMLLSNDSGAVYHFCVRSEADTLIQGRLTVVLNK
jgi:predicted hotdog family 3-hydroxylacyl-ACP dehydratase